MNEVGRCAQVLFLPLNILFLYKIIFIHYLIVYSFIPISNTSISVIVAHNVSNTQLGAWSSLVFKRQIVLIDGFVHSLVTVKLWYDDPHKQRNKLLEEIDCH